MRPDHPAVADLAHELALTRKVLLALPEAHLGWRPHEKSWTLGELAGHLAEIPSYQSEILETDHFDMAEAGPPSAPATTVESIVAAFDANAAKARAALEAAEESQLGTPWALRHGERILLELPRADMLRSMGTSHMIHHRAQLTVYLRLLNKPVPAIYGPSADDAAGFG